MRRARSRFGGRLEPFFRLQMELHEGRGELLTVTGAHTIEARATDKTGYTQTSLQAPEAPNGASGYPVSQITVSA